MTALQNSCVACCKHVDGMAHGFAQTILWPIPAMQARLHLRASPDLSHLGASPHQRKLAPCTGNLWGQRRWGVEQAASLHLHLWTQPVGGDRKGSRQGYLARPNAKPLYPSHPGHSNEAQALTNTGHDIPHKCEVEGVAPQALELVCRHAVADWGEGTLHGGPAVTPQDA